MTQQEAFDIALKGITKQGRTSQYYGTCVYRHPEGLKCGVGHLIPDEEYDPQIDVIHSSDTDVGALKKRNLLPKSLEVFDINFLIALQEAHDKTACLDLPVNFIKEFKEEMKIVAQNYGLTYVE